MERFIFADLVRAIDWFDSGLQNVLHSRGLRTVRRTQSLILLQIANGVDSPGDIGRALALSRQNVHQVAKPLIAAGIIEQSPDPADPRRSRFGWTDESEEIRRVATCALREMEEVIRARVGLSEAEMRVFRKVLTADWGPVITGADELHAECSTPR